MPLRCLGEGQGVTVCDRTAHTRMTVHDSYTLGEWRIGSLPAGFRIPRLRMFGTEHPFAGTVQIRWYALHSPPSHFIYPGHGT
jgi:hypothetical protein